MAKIVKKERANHPGQYKLVLMDDNETIKLIEFKDGAIKIRPEAYSKLTHDEIDDWTRELQKQGAEL